MRHYLTLLVFLALVVLTGGRAEAATSTGPRYLGMAISRGLAYEAVNCRPVEGAVTTLEAAAFLHNIGVPLIANVIPAYVEEGRQEPNGRACMAAATHVYLSEADLRLMQDRYGAQHSTSGLTYTPLDTLSPEGQRREVCGARDWGRRESIPLDGGVFAAANPGGSPIPVEAMDIVQGCGFPWGRDYGSKTYAYAPVVDGRRLATNVRTNMSRDGYARTWSLNGGSCPSWWECGQGTVRRYELPGEVIRDLEVIPANTWTLIQSYRFVKGYKPGVYDCREGYPPRTYKTELYCWRHFEQIARAAKRLGFVFTTPRAVATKWGLQ